MVGGAPGSHTSIAARMETNYVDNWQRRSASPSTFTLCQGRNNRLSLLSSSSTRSSDARSLTRSPPPSYDGLTGLPNFTSSVGADSAHQQGGGDDDDDVSATLDAHLPLSVSDKGWSEVESVSKQFLAENLPGWIAPMQQAEAGGVGQKISNAGQQKPLTQIIKAGVRKGRKGLVLRLLRRTLDANEIVDLRLDNGAVHEKNLKRTYAPKPEPVPEQTVGGGDDGLEEPSPEPALPVELEARPPAAIVHQVPGIHEAPAEPLVFELPTSSATPVPRPAVGVPQRPPARDQAADQAEQDDGDEDVFLATSPTESLLRTLSFGPEEASAWSEPVMDTSDSDYSPPSSIVPTPTKGLSVRHATHRLVKRPRSGGTFASGASEGSRTLPLDMESLNRRLMQSSAESSEEGVSGNEQQPRMDSDNVASKESPERQETVHHEQKQLVRRSAKEHEVQGTPSPHSDQTTADGPSNGKSIAIGNDVATSVDHPRIETARREADSMAATSRSAPRWEGASAQHDLQIPEASGKLVISTNFGPGSDRTTNNAPIVQGPVTVHTPMQVRQDDVRSQMSPHFESNGRVMHELRDVSQGSFDGSVTLPTLNLPEPDSPGGSLWLPSNIEIRPLPEKRSPVHSFLSHATKATLAQLGRVAAGLYDAYGPEKSVPKDHVRVRWTCVSTPWFLQQCKLTFFTFADMRKRALR